MSREALGTLLARFGHNVCLAATLTEGHALLDGQTHLILDLNLPDGPGTELLKRVCAEKRPTRVAVVTGERDSPLLHEAQRLMPDTLRRKPVDLDWLVAWLEHDAMAPA